MTRYVDTVVIPVATENLDVYRKLAIDAERVWNDHGALAYFEGAADPESADEAHDFRPAGTLE